MKDSIKTYFYRLLYKYLSFYIQRGDSVLEVHPQNDRLIRMFQNQRTAVLLREQTAVGFPSVDIINNMQKVKQWKPDYLLLNSSIHYETDIQRFLEELHTVCEASTRLLITYYSSLWNPLVKLATYLKLRDKTSEQNWVAHTDVDNLLLLAGFEPIRRNQRVLIPLYIPLLSDIINRYFAPLPFFRSFTITNILVARPICDKKSIDQTSSVSVVVPARNETGNIEAVITRLPKMGPDDELIFVEGHSTDNTWGKIQEITEKYEQKLAIKTARQDGQGKGDAVRKGFSIASKDILMILDADLTVPPEDLPKFYDAIVSGKGEFINGSRLVYPMERKAMRFWNIVGNKFFATAFSFVLGQRLKDTLCGTKVFTRANYLKIATHRSYFGEFDPFGDFDLLFGASRLGLKIIEIPIVYKERTYGETNIQRWRHGVMLFRMLLFAARRIKFL